MRGRRVVMDSLVANGVSHIFGNPGTTETPLLDSLVSYPQIEYIMTLHEGVAVGAASFYAQASGQTAVANLHVAPGLGNGIGAIYGALKANSPLIVCWNDLPSSSCFLPYSLTSSFHSFSYFAPRSIALRKCVSASSGT